MTEHEGAATVDEAAVVTASAPGAAAAPVKDAGTAETAGPPNAAPADDELLCTICNLRACWQAPAP